MKTSPEPNPAADSRTSPLRGAWIGVAAGAMLPLIALSLARQLAIPLGCPGRFVYLYSPVAGLRLSAVPAAILIGIMLAAGIWLIGVQQRTRRRVGVLLLTVGGPALALWTYFAPPTYFNQHVFNTGSRSHDGAFVDEALQISDVRTYLREFPQRVRTPQQVMGGTRVISNPPGATLLACCANLLIRGVPALDANDIVPFDHSIATSTHHATAVGIVFFWLLIALWLLAGPAFYAVGRLYWPAATAATFAILGVFTPATLLFSPGKDPAQLLTVALPLLLWVYAIRRGAAWAGALAGLAFLLATLMSLVHVWVALIVLCATGLSTLSSRDARRRTTLRGLLPATGGFVAGALLLYVVADFNLIASARAVAASQAEVTRGPDAMPLVWQVVGIPLFLLFAGVGWWVAMLVTLATPRPGAPDDTALEQSDARFGRYLLIATIIVLLGTVGFTNIETPRLWIPFVPLMLLGGFLQVRSFRTPSRATLRLLAVVVVVHVTCAAVQWSFMDMREAETRIIEQRYFH